MTKQQDYQSHSDRRSGKKDKEAPFQQFGPEVVRSKLSLIDWDNSGLCLVTCSSDSSSTLKNKECFQSLTFSLNSLAVLYTSCENEITCIMLQAMLNPARASAMATNLNCSPLSRKSQDASVSWKLMVGPPKIFVSTIVLW